MAYVDLNPIRANMADTLEASNHTSIQYRLNAKRVGKTPKRLMKFSDCTTQSNSLTVSSAVLPFTLEDYFTFVAATGKVKDKSGQSQKTITFENWNAYINIFKSGCTAVGSVASLRKYKEKKKLLRIRGMGYNIKVLVCGKYTKSI